MTVNDKLSSFPPILIRLLARARYGGVLSSGEIARQSGLRETTVDYIADKLDWSGVFVDECLRFCRGCGLDLDDSAAWSRTMDYLRKDPTFRYLRCSPQWNSTYKPMLKRWVFAPHAQNIHPYIRRLIARLTCRTHDT